MSVVNLSRHHLQEKDCALVWVSSGLHRPNSVPLLFTAGTTAHRTPAPYRITPFPGGKGCFCAIQRRCHLSFSTTGARGSLFGKLCPTQLPLLL